MCDSITKRFIVDAAPCCCTTPCRENRTRYQPNRKFARPFDLKRPVFRETCLLFANNTEKKPIFYCEDKSKNELIKKLKITDELYLMAVCVQTFLVNKNGKVLIVFYKMFTETEKFKKCFYDEKTRKLAIDVITFSSRSRDDRF